jgi:hypothetical protein
MRLNRRSAKKPAKRRGGAWLSSHAFRTTPPTSAGFIMARWGKRWKSSKNCPPRRADRARSDRSGIPRPRRRPLRGLSRTGPQVGTLRRSNDLVLRMLSLQTHPGQPVSSSSHVKMILAAWRRNLPAGTRCMFFLTLFDMVSLQRQTSGITEERR